MNNQNKENLTYITGVEELDEEEKSNINSSTNSPIKNKKRNYKSIEHSETKTNRKIISIVFPIIKPTKNKDIFSVSQKYMKTNSRETNVNDICYKSQKNISVSISNLKNKPTKIIYDNNNNKNNNSFESDSKNNSIINSNYCMTSLNVPNKLSINRIECNLNLDKDNRNKKLYNKFNNNNMLFNSPSSKTQILKQRLFNKEHGESIFNQFLKKELRMEDKIRLFPLFLERYSPRLLRKKNTKKRTKKVNFNENKNDNNNDEYKIRIGIFKNQTIPYLEKIDSRQLSTHFNLPPLKFGSKFGIQERTEDSIKKEKYYNEIEKFEKERKKGKSEKKKMTKKELLKIFKNKKLLNCRNLIDKTKINITDTKNKIDKIYNKLKLSLNEYDDWNSPKNADNLYDS